MIPDSSPPQTEVTRTPEVPQKGILRDYFETIVICVIFVVAARAFVFQQSKIPTGSMIPTLLIGDYIVVNKFIYAPAATGFEKAILPLRDIRRGDIVVFKYPVEPEKDYIKRIIGLPGDVIEIRNKTVYINGEPLDEPYKVHETEQSQDSWRRIREGEAPASLSAATSTRRLTQHFRGDEHFNYGPVRVPEDSYFAMGDNRDNSKDSRAWGFVPRDNVKGRAFVIFWSFSGEEGDHNRTGIVERTKSVTNKVLHFLTKSRYRRVFRLIS